jgi:hypothetical protein
MWDQSTNAATFDCIGTVTVQSGGSASITFAGIPQTYTNLQLRGIGRTSRPAGAIDDLFIRFNGDAGSNYTQHIFFGSSGSVAYGTSSAQTYAYAGQLCSNNATTYNAGLTIIDIPEYTNTNKQKITSTIGGGVDSGVGTGNVDFTSGLWASTVAITSLTLITVNPNFQQYTQFSLYGLR